MPGCRRALLDELLEAPARAVAGEHGKVVQVEVAVLVRVGYLVVVYLAQPVVRGYRAGVREDEAADGVVHRGVLLDAPVARAQIAVHDVLVVEVGVLHVAQLLALAAVEDIRLRDVLVPAAGEDGLDAVLDILDGDGLVGYLVLEVRRDLEGEEVDNALVILRARGLEGLLYGVAYLLDVEIDKLAVPLFNPVHVIVLLCKTICFFSLSYPAQPDARHLGPDDVRKTGHLLSREAAEALAGDKVAGILELLDVILLRAGYPVAMPSKSASVCRPFTAVVRNS